eukprot:3722700-Amphidinium_carterae.1
MDLLTAEMSKMTAVLKKVSKALAPPTPVSRTIVRTVVRRRAARRCSFLLTFVVIKAQLMSVGCQLSDLDFYALPVGSASHTPV